MLQIQQWPISRQLVLLLVVIFGPGLVASVLFLQRQWDTALDRAYSRTAIVLEAVHHDLDGMWRDHESTFREVATNINEADLRAGHCPPAAVSYDNIRTDITGITFRLLDGRVLCSTLNRVDDRLAPEFDSLLRVVAAGGALPREITGGRTALVNNVMRDDATGTWFSAMIYPLRDREGAVFAFLSARLDLREFNVRVFFDLPQNLQVSIQDASGKVALRSEEFDRWVGRAPPAGSPVQLSGETQGRFRGQNIEGVAQIGSFALTERAPWRIEVAYPEDEVLGPYRGTLRNTILAVVLGSALLAFLAWRISSGVSRSLRGLAPVSQAVAGRNFGARAALYGPREVKLVSHQFNAMLDAIGHHQEERLALNRHVNTLMQNARDSILLLDDRGAIFQANHAAEAAYRRQEEDLLKINFESLRAGVESERDKSPWAAANTLEGVQYEDEHRRSDGSTFPVEVSARAIEVQGRTYIQCFVRDISGRRRREAESREYLSRIEKMFGSTVDSISAMGELRDPYTAGHQGRVGRIAVGIAAEIGLSEDVQRGLSVASALHDIGKIAIPSELLTKPTRLSEQEFALIKTHAAMGYEVLRHVQAPWPVAEIARQHHERMDGSGYPRGLKGEEILLEARIVAVADVIESMASFRPYRAGLGVGIALEEIEKNRGKLYDEAVADACLRLFREKGFTLPV